MEFIKSIEKGLERADCYKKNKNEILGVLQEIDDTIYEKCGKRGAIIARNNDNFIIFGGFINYLNFNNSTAYPVVIDTIAGKFKCENKNKLIEALEIALSSASFGFYLKRVIGETT